MEWKKNLPEIKKTVCPDFPETLKTKLRENLDKIWVHNFPWSNLKDLLSKSYKDKNVKHDFELFGLEKDNINIDKISENFSKSKIYKWLINIFEQKN